MTDADRDRVVAAIRAIPRPMSAPVSVHVRGRDITKTVLRVLTAGELSAARANAERAAKEVLADDAKVGGLAYEEEYELQKAFQIVALAAWQAEDTRFPAFPRPVDVRENLTDDEISVLIVAYNRFRLESGPIKSELKPEELEAWEALLMKELRNPGAAARLAMSALSAGALTDLVLHLLEKLAPPAPAPEPTDGQPAGAEGG